MIEPTNGLLKIAKQYQVKMVFFVDVGYLIKLEECMAEHPTLQSDNTKVREQLARIVAEGHDIQLHIHPHWEKSFYADGKWNIITKNAYKLSDFSDEEIKEIVTKYKAYLDDIIGYKTKAFRAGGWCIQPFHRLKDVFQELEIKFDTSVFPGGKFSSSKYAYDFTLAPFKSTYHFSDDECKEDFDGYFKEYPISSMYYSPYFYWRLYILGRLFPSQHKMIGDGNFMPQPGKKKHVLLHFNWNHVSSDGYYASKLLFALKKFKKDGKENLVVIGHPKGMTKYSMRKMKQFIKASQKGCQYCTFKDLH